MKRDIPHIQEIEEIRYSYTYSEKIDFKSKTVTKGKEGHYIMIQRSTHQEVITIINIYAPSIRTLKYIK